MKNASFAVVNGGGNVHLASEPRRGGGGENAKAANARAPERALDGASRLAAASARSQVKKKKKLSERNDGHRRPAGRPVGGCGCRLEKSLVV